MPFMKIHATILLAVGLLLMQGCNPAKTTAPAETTPLPQAVDTLPPVDLVTEVQELQREVVATRNEVHQLQETLDVLVNQMMSDLANENDFLRAEIQAYIDEQKLLAEEALLAEAEMVEEEALPNDGETTYTVIQEWGRSPEDAAELPGGATSLKGMVVAVPMHWNRATIEAAGRELHAEFSAYDNINIELLRGKEAAEAYAENSKASGNARVMSISKHKASGRDVLLYIEEEKVTVLD